ncbi:uncharacterized protein LOC124416415 isoform X1 [Diprion similis]|uniref:uncharacterized protein LOC124416415 isoform X1 n=2 Tax=Diprion similis TaxID=362088 RepID=UPI001EF943E5|nr:uncharacterized protein LOC124416415 isoform X1 [Diprion similis]
MHAVALDQIMGDTDNPAPCNGTSILEDDLALSPSTMGMSNKSTSDLLVTNSTSEVETKVIYMSEDAMDCVYTESNETFKDSEVIDQAPSPDMFGSDTEDAPKSNSVTEPDQLDIKDEDSEICQADLVAKSDSQLLNRIHEALSGVPPPPSVTISQMDCNDFLRCIKQNSHLFWPRGLCEEKNLDQIGSQDSSNVNQKLLNSESTNLAASGSSNTFYQQIKSGSRNLMNAFDACDSSSVRRNEQHCHGKSDNENCEKTLVNKKLSDPNLAVESDSSTLSNFVCHNSTLTLLNDSRESRTTISVNETTNEDKPSLLNYRTIIDCDPATLEWPEAYAHKHHGIHYNRSIAVEDFEYLSIKLCERYVGAETQSTCHPWFTKQAPGSATKRKMLGRRNVGQSPGRRLSHLARRRRAFSSANLQGMGLTDKRQVVLDIKKTLIKKGKSPRGKGIRGKSPRSSAKKRAARRLTMEGSSPRKSKLETSKRALFQSPPGDRAGPSRINTIRPVPSLNPQKIKRALFPTPNKKDDVEKRVSFEDTKKRKSEDDLEGPRPKWAKSLSFDCPRGLEKKQTPDCKIERHSTGSVLAKSEGAVKYRKGELTETNKKKLLWAVAEALRGKGIGMNHPQFKQYGSLLARTVRKSMPDLENQNIPRKPGSTSDRMLKFAKQYVLTIVDPKPTNC